jgi:hypothetical protein
MMKATKTHSTLFIGTKVRDLPLDRSIRERVEGINKPGCFKLLIYSEPTDRGEDDDSAAAEQISCNGFYHMDHVDATKSECFEPYVSLIFN